MCWYVKQFPNGQVELRPQGGLAEFAEVFEAFARTRAGAAVFCTRDQHGGVTVYFPPVASEFARMIRASEAEQPRIEELTPLCGDRRVLDWYVR